jgi:hypothetical protein
VTSQLRWSGKARPNPFAIRGGSSKEDSPQVVSVKCTRVDGKRTQRFSVKKLWSVVAGEDAQALSPAET